MRVERKHEIEIILFRDLKPGDTFENADEHLGHTRMKVDSSNLLGRKTFEYLAVNLSNGVLVETNPSAEVRPVNVTAVEE